MVSFPRLDSSRKLHSLRRVRWGLSTTSIGCGCRKNPIAMSVIFASRNGPRVDQQTEIERAADAASLYIMLSAEDGVGVGGALEFEE